METKFSGLWWRIIAETAYLLFMALGSLFLIAFLWWWTPGWLGLDVTEPVSGQPLPSGDFQHFALACLAGIIGGSAIAMKWLHHAVGQGPKSKEVSEGWSYDSVLWRFLVPILSGLIALVFYAALESGLLNLQIDTQAPNAFAVAFGFLAGYFSDRAAAKLKEIAYVLFGDSEGRGERKLEEMFERKLEELFERKLEELIVPKLQELVDRTLAERDAGGSAGPDDQ